MGACNGKEGTTIDLGSAKSPHDLRPPRIESAKRVHSRRERFAGLARSINSLTFLEEVLKREEPVNPKICDLWAAEADPAFMESPKPSVTLPPNPSAALPCVEVPAPTREHVPLSCCSRTRTRPEPEGELEPEKEPEREPSGDEVGAPCGGSLPSKPDFTGSWVCSRVEGDWDSFLKEVGVAWALRKAIASMNFGVGRQTQDIDQTEEQISVKNVVNSFPPREAISVFRLDGQEQEVVELDGQHTRSTTYWDDGTVLVTEQHSIATLQPLPTIRRFMQGEEMCTTRTATSGLQVKRIYTRR